MTKLFFYIKNNIINLIFLILFSLYLLFLPFYIDVSSTNLILLFGVVSLLFYVNLFFLLKNIYKSKKYFSIFLVCLFQFWLLVFLFINIENLFIWNGYLHAKYFYFNFGMYAFHGIIFLVLSYILYKNISIFSNKERKLYITTIFFIFLIYNILPSVKIPYVPSGFLVLNQAENKYYILKQDYNSEEKDHFLNNSEYYINKLQKNNEYKYLFNDEQKILLKIDIYNYEFNSSIDGLKSTISVPFLINYSDLVKHERFKYYYSFINGNISTIYIPTIGKYTLSNLFIKSSIGDSISVSENRLNYIYNQLEEIFNK